MSEQPRDKGLAELDRQEATGSPGPLHPKDRVRVTFESNYEDVEIAMWHNRPLMSIATVEVLERADDPSLNDLGTLRLEAHDDDPGHSVWLCTQDRHGKRGWFCVYSTAVGNQGGRMEDDEVAGLPVVGALIATPAAEAEKPAPREVSMSTRQRVAELLVRGEFADAVNVVGVAWTPWDEARAFVKAMPEYRTGENHRPVDDVPLPPLHVDNDAIVTGRYPEQREPRVFRSDGPEPPEDVTVLEMVNTKSALRGTPYLKRLPGEPSAWSWVAYPGQKVSREWGHSRWPINDVVFLGEFREVV